tara:strand:- start:5075 stop:5254 length:180 start_codon:yes stop_codon:yes gene_type:complete
MKNNIDKFNKFNKINEDENYDESQEWQHVTDSHVEQLDGSPYLVIQTDEELYKIKLERY